MKVENRFIKLSELAELLGVKEVRAGKYGIFVDDKEENENG